MKKNKALVSVIMGSDSDLPIMQETAQILEKFAVGYEIEIISAHRTPHKIAEFAATARARGIRVIVTGAGGAAHLAGVTAAFTTLPVIGVPIKAKSLEGFDSLCSIVQMPPGVPVATVGINGAKNAGLLALQILAVSDEELTKKLEKYKEQIADEVKNKNEKLAKIGYQKYLANLQK
jgi:5-(carboxyamino)imidazole ribonucleotide mutase